MMHALRTVLFSGFALGLTACMAPVGSKVEVPRDAANTCAGHCNDIGLALDSVVIMANNVGCVCRPSGGKAVGEAGAHAGGGMAAIIAMEEAQQSQQHTYTPAH